MKIFRHLNDLPSFEHPVLTIGTFDGVHLGHQQLLQRIGERAKERSGESILLTFYPHPRLVLNPNDQSVQLITSMSEKIALLEHYGLDHLIIATFTRQFAQTTPKEYIRDFLVESIHPEVIVIGYDHHFGKNRAGGITELRAYASEFGYTVEEIEKHLVDDIGVSSTKIRHYISDGAIKKANALLGHPFQLSGRVIKGHQIGNALGYPTANLFIEDKNKIVPGAGIYAVRINIDSCWHKGMLYIGFRPTFSGTEKTIEVNVFDFTGNLYGQTIELQVIEEIRGDQRFTSPEALQTQMAADKKAALAILKNYG